MDEYNPTYEQLKTLNLVDLGIEFFRMTSRLGRALYGVED